MFHGSIVALLTPFSPAGEIELTALKRLVNFHLEAGTNALVIAGTTGESATLEKPEFRELVSAAIRYVDGKIPVIAGTGSASTQHAIDQSLVAQSLGASAVLVVTPYYNRPTQAGLAAHFEAVADAISVPLIMYNVPSRTAVDLQPQTAAALAQHEGIVGLKEAVGDIQRVTRLVTDCPSDFTVLSGDDPTCLAAMKAGAKGVISVASNIVPGLMGQMCKAAAEGDWDRAATINQSLASLYETLALETNPIPVKWAAFEMGLIGPNIRLPLLELSKKYRNAVVECLNELEHGASA
jgi:4-hydroxy-tetrahydrodipicolinate synthase